MTSQSDDDSLIIPDFINMTAVLYEPEAIQIRYNITNINPSLIFIDDERFFLR